VSFSTKVFTGLVAGLLVGVVLGELVAPLKIFADGFIKLLQMTVLPYVTISIISSLGALDADEAKRLGVRAGAVLAGLWVVALTFALLIPLAFPTQARASFFSSSLIEDTAAFDFIDLYIPSNPFRSLANGVVPAIVLFAIVLGIAMIGLDRKQVLLDVLSTASALVSRATRLIVGLTPYGMFAIAAHAAGTLRLQQLGQIQVYLVTYVAVALLLALWFLPGVIATLTPIRHREVLGHTRAALVTAFMAADLFIVLPILVESCKELLAKHRLADSHTSGIADVLVPASFNFPHTGKLLSVSFVLFAAWFADVTLHAMDYPRVAVTGLLTFFGSLNAAVPFLLDLFHIPADTFQLYVATGVINSHFGALLAALHTVAVALLGTAAINGRLAFNLHRIGRFAVITTVLTAATIGGLRTLFTAAMPHQVGGADVVYGMKPVFEPVDVRVVSSASRPAPDDDGESHLRAVQQRGAVRVCVLAGRLPYAFADEHGTWKGFDIEMAHRLAHDTGVRLELVPTTLEHVPAAIEGGGCDIAMSGIPVTPFRATVLTFSEPYLDETLAWVVRDHLRDRFTSWEEIRKLGVRRVGAPNLPYYLQEVRDRAPALAVDAAAPDATPDDFSRFDAFVMPAERGSVWTLLHPEFTVVVPGPDVINVPLAYPVCPCLRWEAYVNTWIELKRRDGTIDRLFRRWILGQEAIPVTPRWSVVRNVLQWVD
jgi:Na+/H+-dicarboxylate symporter/ABC-type amino acid transport substrate-binding protein